ncbi:MAG: hypothetical protein NT069_18195, partial [Planctomycetota bacterium]|nr:hypothetical protein [Planctomycetota bacterium]
MSLSQRVCSACTLFSVLIAANSFADEPARRVIHSQPSVLLSTPQVELAVTEVGGHMSPVTFFR